MNSDWEQYKKLLPLWQERYMDKLIKEYQSIVNSNEHSSAKLWQIKEKINQDFRHPGVVMELGSKKALEFSLLRLYQANVITKDDLISFSKEMQSKITKAASL